MLANGASWGRKLFKLTGYQTVCASQTFSRPSVHKCTELRSARRRGPSARTTVSSRAMVVRSPGPAVRRLRGGGCMRNCFNCLLLAAGTQAPPPRQGSRAQPAQTAEHPAQLDNSAPGSPAAGHDARALRRPNAASTLRLPAFARSPSGIQPHHSCILGASHAAFLLDSRRAAGKCPGVLRRPLVAGVLMRVL